MKTIKNLIWMAVVAMTMAACSNADDFGEAPGGEVAGDRIVTLTATLSAKGGDDAMRSVDANGVTTWVVGEELMLQYDQTPSGSASAKATVTAVTGGVATIKATLVNPKNGGEVQLDYPYSYADPGSTIDILTDQDGTIDKISQYFDYARDAYHATGIGSSYTLTVSGSEASIPSNIVMKNTNCIWKFKFTDGTNDITNKINKLVINDGSGDYTITPSGLSEICVSLFPASSLNIVITAYTVEGMYRIAKSGITTEEGKIYTTTGLALKKVEVGKLLGADGNVYADAAAATAASTTAVAMIAYVGSDAETSTTYNHGLALALSDVSGSSAWCSQTSSTCLSNQYSEATKSNDVAGIANTDALVGHGSHTHTAASKARNYNSGNHPAGTSDWFLPSAGQWDKMMTGTGGYGLANLKTTANGYTGLQSNDYWSSSEINAQRAWNFSAVNGGWNYGSKDNAALVRACLAF